MFGALLCGLFVPGIEALPKEAVPYIMAVIIFFAASKIKQEDFKSIHVQDIALIYALRFLVLPCLAFFVLDAVLPAYKYAVFLLLLLPTGATLPAVTSILGGNPMVALSFLTLTSLSAPFVIPAFYGAFSGATLTLDPVSMFKTLAFIIFLPIGLYILLMKTWKKGLAPVRDNASFMAVTLICLVGMIIVASQREVILSDLAFLLQAFGVGLVVYLALYAAGWLAFAHKNLRERVSYALACGNNNIAIGISLAFLYLPEQETITLVMWELSWISALALCQYALSKRKAE
jgi:BASS family bile acid:Na+ symporter